MPIHVVNRRRSAARIESEHPGAEVVDVTSRGPDPWEARHRIYLPAYRWVLEHRLADLVTRLRQHDDLVLLDYTVNSDPDDPSSPLSHAALLRRWLVDDWPAQA